jgi:hypothetical protein
MHSESDLESDSSLPIHPRQTFPSSPPAIKAGIRFATSPEMDSQPYVKSESPATQDEEPSKPSPKRVSSEETERPPSAQQMQRDDDISDETDEEPDNEEDMDSDPAHTIVDFDWDELHRQYHDAMNTCQAEEGELAREWENLMNVQMRYFVAC